MTVQIAVRRLPHNADLPLPAYATAGAAGMDLLAAVDAPVTIEPGKRALIPTGLAIALPPGYELQIRPRSGLALRHGIVLPNSPGTIDEDYRGEIQVIVLNAGDAPFTVERGARIAQAVLAPVVRAPLARGGQPGRHQPQRRRLRQHRALIRRHAIATAAGGDLAHRAGVTGRAATPARGRCQRRSTPPSPTGRRLPNAWDAAAILCVFAALIGVAHVARGTFERIDAPEALAVSLDPIHLPDYALRTTMRMFAALLASLLFTFTYATAAAKSRRAALILIPILDILQSVPILGFLTFTVVFFMRLFPGRVLGLELAAIFAIFTSQAWNMAFSLYQSLKTVPADLKEAADSFHLTAWQRFWRLEVPFATPGLVWNTMMSMSGGWFFVVASEAVSVGDNTWKLPGIGSYVALALEQRDILAVLLRHRGDAGGDPGVRPVAVPPAGRLVGEVPLRDDRRRDRRRSLAAAADAAHAAAEPAGRCDRRCASRRSAACALAFGLRRGAAEHAAVARWSMRSGSWCSPLCSPGRWRRSSASSPPT